MRVGRPPLQPALKRQMHGWHGSGLPQPAGADAMVHCQTVATYELVNSKSFFVFSELFLEETHQDTC
jgi:hypothetical protein